MNANGVTSRRVPVNVITGALGAGKTTAVNHLLRNRPGTETWAVLVNEYGLVGLDAVLLEDAGRLPGVLVKQVAGGCICCSAGIVFDASLLQLLRRRPDRLIIEPTGLATLSGVIDTLSRRGIREAIDLRTVICLVDPSTIDQDLQRPEVRNQCRLADVLLANRCDLANANQLQRFDTWARQFSPRKRFIGMIDRGRIPAILLDCVAETPDFQAQERLDYQAHEHDAGASTRHGDLTSEAQVAATCDAQQPVRRFVHRSSIASTLGWICSHELVFNSDLVSGWLNTVSDMPGTIRAKAVVRTGAGWRSYNYTAATREQWVTGKREDSRLEFVFDSRLPANEHELEATLMQCALPSGRSSR